MKEDLAWTWDLDVGLRLVNFETIFIFDLVEVQLVTTCCYPLYPGLGLSESQGWINDCEF